MADQGARSDKVKKPFKSVMTGAEEFDGAVYAGPSHSGNVSRGNVIGQAGNTWYEYQHNGSMGRQVSYSPVNDYAHFVWMRWPTSTGPRHIRYNAYNSGAGWAWGSGATAGKDVSGTNGGYTTIDVTPAGAAVAAWHEGGVPTAYDSYASKDYNTPLGFFDDYTANPAPAPPSCTGETTTPPAEEGRYIWPVVDFDSYNGDEITHVVSCESPPGDEASDPQSIIYYRAVNGVWDDQCGAYGAACGLFMGLSYTISPVVRSDPNSDDVAVVWLKPMYLDGDPNDPCGWTQWQNDIVYYESNDAGCHWGGLVNVTDYSQGGTLTPDQMQHQAYTDVSALYTSDGCLHIVWSTPLRDLQGDTPCNPLYATRVWHWDDCNDEISLVYDATTPRFFCPTGAFMMSTGKCNISECTIEGDPDPDTTRLYVMFSRMGAHTSADGDTNADCSIPPPDNEFGNFANSDIFIVGSSDDGLTWGPSADLPLYEDGHQGDGTQVTQGAAVNATNTETDQCMPGDCLSEHWGSMAKYNYDVLHIMYVEDHDAGAGIRDDPQEGQLTDNPMIYMQEPCFAIKEICGVVATPLSGAITIAPQGGEGCTVPETATFDITVTNTGNQSASFNAVASDPGLVPSIAPSSGSVGVGGSASQTLTCTIGPYASEGRYTVTITITANCGGDDIVIVVTLEIYVKCFPPEYATLSTACWSIAVWNTARAGDTDDAVNQMFWFPTAIPPEGDAFMYDEGVVITIADDTTETYTSVFDGGTSGLTLVSMSPLTTASFATYEYAHALWATSDNEFGPGEPKVVGEIEYFLPTHPDTCILAERIKVCNNTDAALTIHIGEAIDWDIPDTDGDNNNDCGDDPDLQIVYQIGTNVPPETDYYGTVQFCNDIPGAIVVDNESYVYPSSGYDPAELGGFMNSLNDFQGDCAEADDYSSIYVADRSVTLEPDSCAVYCKVKAGSVTGLADLEDLLIAGRYWIAGHDIECSGECCCCPEWPAPDASGVGDADGSATLDIDDVVYLINRIFSGGEAPKPCPVASGDADGSYTVDIDDVVYLINRIFSGGPPPPTCTVWVTGCSYAN
jgi:uncharacterized repeat protein (TIGR01451 family)